MNIRFSNPSILAGEVLAPLGQINAICGKNSSGKSTVLQAIATGNFEVGYLRDSHGVVDIASVVLGTTFDNQGNSLVPWLAQQIEQELNKLFNSKKVPYASDLQIFASKIKEIVEARRGLGVNMPLILQRLQGAFASNPKSTLLPAKRTFPDRITITQNPQALSSGTGVIDSIFSKRNKLTAPNGVLLMEELRTVFQEVSGGYQFDISLEESDLKLMFSYKGSELAPASQFGLGLQDLLIILFWAIQESDDWLLIEEPESHLHPTLQRSLLKFLRSSSKTCILATHSNVMLDETYVDQIFQTTFSDSRIHISSESSRASILDELGYLAVDNLVADLLVLVEGPTDREAMEEFLAKLPRSSKVIKFWPLGGDIMDKQDLGVLSGSFKLFVLMDREDDKGSRRARERVIEQCKIYGIPYLLLERYALENYYTIEAYRHVFGGQVHIDTISPSKKVLNQIGFDVKKNTRQLARATDFSQIEGTDLGQAIQTWVS